MMLQAFSNGEQATGTLLTGPCNCQKCKRIDLKAESLLLRNAFGLIRLTAELMKKEGQCTKGIQMSLS